MFNIPRLILRLGSAIEALRAEGLLVNTGGPLNPSRILSSVVADSRQVRRGCVFVAIRGTRSDGIRFAGESVRKGAAAVVADRAVKIPRGAKAAVIQVTDSAKALGALSGLEENFPSKTLRVYGVTGTNGKTTTTYLIRRLLKGLGRRTALLGTVSEEIPGLPAIEASMTTPNVQKLNKFFNLAISAGCDSAVFEVSSHSLDQRRVWGIRFETVVFTNLTQDHLDYHKTMGEYFEAKKKLFIEYGYRRAAVNADDPYGRRLAAELARQGREVITFGRHPKSAIRILNSKFGLGGTSARLRAFGRTIPLRLKLVGDYNLSNAAAALAACADESNISKLAEILSRADAPPGRMERVDAGQPYVVLVDYAHTPDALEKLLRACRRLNPRRLICVFGCGGDRDRTKRPKMGRVATTIADVTIVTSDNPRTEKPQDIIAEIQRGLRGRAGKKYQIEPDRRAAIRIALDRARRGDIVVIAGKGHENYQIIGTTKHPFDDRKIARAAIRRITC